MKISSCWIELLIISPLERLKNVFMVQKEFVAWLALAHSAAVGNFLQHKSGCCSPYIRLFLAKSLPSGESVTFIHTELQGFSYQSPDCTLALIFLFFFKHKTILFIFSGFFLLNVLMFNWKIIALQYCVVFCHTSTWISHRYSYVPSILKLPPTSHRIPTL